MPGRENLLAEAMGSVAAQTVAPACQLVRVEAPPAGLSPLHLAHQHNVLLGMVDTTWVAVLDDDDLYTVDHFETVAGSGHMGDEGADVIYTFGLGNAAPRNDVSEWTNEEMATKLARGNCVSSNALIRVSALRAVGGWCDDASKFDAARGVYTSTKATWEDWDLWSRMVRAAGPGEERVRFRCVPVVTWTYRSGDWERCTG